MRIMSTKGYLSPSERLPVKVGWQTLETSLAIPANASKANQIIMSDEILRKH
jgi:hypothetical protein